MFCVLFKHDITYILVDNIICRIHGSQWSVYKVISPNLDVQNTNSVNKYFYLPILFYFFNYFEKKINIFHVKIHTTIKSSNT